MILSSSLLLRNSLSKTFTIVKSKMLSQHGRSYEEAINTLNGLQTNSQYLKDAIIRPKAETNLAEVTKFIKRTGLALEELDKLSVIHIAGTNGKGSTCAYSESILRNHGFKTGFYSSPHLLDVRERIRIDGKPISKKEFALYFWKVYDLLDKHKTVPDDMPLYFRYLTILALHIFLEYKVDVAVIEVGIGGEYDCTNIIRKTAVAGITPLDFDHTSILGESIESIAWNKGGIMKKGCMAFTTQQPQSGMKILKQRSLQTGCDLKVVEDDYYKCEGELNIPLHIQRTNASLALAICEAYVTRGYIDGRKPQKAFSMEIAKKAIEETRWPGRYEIKDYNKLRRGPYYRQHERDRPSDVFFKELCKFKFDVVLFTPNVSSENDVLDNKDFVLTTDVQLQRCDQYREDWLKMEGSLEHKADKVLVLPCFSQAVKFFGCENEYDILVTGSIHLVGAALAVIDPTLNVERDRGDL